MKRRDRNAPIWPLLLAMGMLLGAAGTLLWLRGRLVAGQQSVLDGTVRRFEATGVLGRPESDSVIFGEIERLAAASENELIRSLRVVKRAADGRELTLVPFYVDLTEPRWRDAPGWIRLPVGAEPAGYLYVRIDRSTIHAVNAAIMLLGLLLVGGLGALLARQRGKEAQVNRLQSELEQRKVQVIQLERLALAGQLSANVFHDIKKPVLNIKHEVDDALDGTGQPIEEVLRSVRAQTDLFLQMLRELGMEAFVNAAAENREWCDLAEAVDRSLRLVGYERGNVQTQVHFPPDREFLIEGIPHRFVQLFSNLFLNAFQAMGHGGTLRVRGMENEEWGMADKGSTGILPVSRQPTDGDWLVIDVEDSGPGIPEEKRAEVFSPFVTGRAASGGSGLGLYICRTIVEDLGGTITVDKSEEMGGARFRVRLPAASR